MLSPLEMPRGIPQSAPEYAELVYRYIAVWNEHDPVLRRRRIEHVWVPDGCHFWRQGIVQGYDALEARVLGSYRKWIADGKFQFQAAAAPLGQQSGVRLHWLMVPTDGGAPEGRGCEFLVLAPDGRIQADYQFPEA